tara:strand:- start:250 stop:585 length:336 start_codon:yes stop_codon:yes gene_type:complete
MIEQAIKEYYGERCSDHDDDCVVCQAWEQWDQIAPATVVDADPILEAAGFVGDELFHPHEVVALMQKAFDKGWDQTGVAATSLHQDFPSTHNHNRDKHVVRFLKEAMAENE